MAADCLEGKGHWTRQVEPISTVVAAGDSLLNNRINFTEG